jgi:hypothetical protein
LGKFAARLATLAPRGPFKEFDAFVAITLKEQEDWQSWVEV